MGIDGGWDLNGLKGIEVICLWDLYIYSLII
jgi:hypothetical protein